MEACAMTLALCYDTETTSLPLWHEPSSDPRQPHLVSIAAALVDTESRKALTSLNLFAKAEGWEIDADAQRAHGISVEETQRIGIAERTLVSAFIQLWRQADFRVAHNESFDMRIIRIALSRYESICDPDVWKGGRAECTQRLSTPLCRLPPTDKMLAKGRKGFKSPNLTEAYRHFTGQELVGAHSALADLRACIAVYWGCMDAAAGETAAAAPEPEPTPPPAEPEPESKAAQEEEYF